MEYNKLESDAHYINFHVNKNKIIDVTLKNKTTLILGLFSIANVTFNMGRR